MVTPDLVRVVLADDEALAQQHIVVCEHDPHAFSRFHDHGPSGIPG